MSKILPLEELTQINDRIILEDDDNLNSARVLVCQYCKKNKDVKIKVIRDYTLNKMVILRVK